MIRHANSARRRIAAVVGAAALLATFATGVQPASAATESFTFDLSGTITVGGPPDLTLPAGSTITFDHDPATGAVTNAVANIPTFDRGQVSGPQALITLTNTAPGTGTWDRATGAASLAISLGVSLEIPLLEATCDLGAPIVLELGTSEPGGQPVVGDPATGTVAAYEFEVADVFSNATCSEDSVTLVNDFLGLPTTESAAILTVTEQKPPVPAPTPEPVTPAFTG